MNPYFFLDPLTFLKHHQHVNVFNYPVKDLNIYKSMDMSMDEFRQRTDIHDSRMLNPNDFDDALTFNLLIKRIVIFLIFYTSLHDSSRHLYQLSN